MRILPFRKPAPPRIFSEATDWSQQELADFYRAHRLLVENGAAIGMDRGVSDGGDPWVAFYDLATQDAFLHVARIDGACVLVCDPLSLRITASSIGDLIATFESEVRRLLNLRREGGASIILHPASRIIMSISAVFLLFKFENSGGFQSKTAGGDAAGTDIGVRKMDAGALARVQSALGRLYDSLETPAAVAALAGVILSVELAGIASKEALKSVAEADPHRAHEFTEAPVHAGDGEAGRMDASELRQAALADAATEDAAAKHPVVVEKASLEDIAPVAVPAAPVAGNTTRTAEAALAQKMTPEGYSGTAVPALVEKSAPVVAIDTEQSGSAVPDAKSGASTLAFRAVEIFVADLATDSHHVVTINAAPEPVPAGLPMAGHDHDAGLSVPDPDDGFGLTRVTELTGPQLTETLMQFVSLLGDYEIELLGDRVLIEQRDIAGLDGQDLGIWTNMMSDGSEISVIGQIDVVEDVTTLIA